MDEILAMPLTFIMNFPDDLNLRLIAESEKKVAEICSSIKELHVSSHVAKKRARILNFIGKAESPAARLFGLELHANSQCISCGICWENCPEKNISQKKSGKPGFGFSNDAFGRFGPKDFEECLFPVNGDTEISMTTRYL